MSTQEPDDENEYFNIEDECLLRCKFIHHKDKKELMLKLHQGRAPYPDSEKLYMSLESQIQEKLQKIKSNDPAIEEILAHLNQKINLVASNVNPNKADGLMNQMPERVRLSATSISFETQEPYALGQDCQIEIILLPKQIYLLAYGHVVSCENFEPEDERLAYEHKRHRVMVEFDAIKEEDSERLIQHILRLEAYRMRQSRQSNP